ncbi:MAG: hypothetical protein LIP06_01105 [Tannerellaceae bacterium]|nr:hypothetical protein [Tannerellaceae bacterium]
MTFGLFQHFDYYDSQLKNKEGETEVPYRISQAAAVGGGLLYNKVSEVDMVDIYAEFYVNGVALGASQTDYFRVDERDYNLGSGYSLKTFAGLTYRKTWNFQLNAENYHIFTWKGYDPDLDLSTVDYETLNVQGDKGNARLTVFSTQLTYYSGHKWNISLTNRYFSRSTYYKYHDNYNTSTSDLIVSVGVNI